MTRRIALDAMGGDNAPDEIVAGAIQAVAALDVEVVLVGQPEQLQNVDLEVVPASEVITMDADPARSVRTMKDSSIVRGAELVRDGKADAFVSAGNTGAMVAASLLRMGRIKGVARPAVATTIPVPGSTPTVLLDSGAIAECQADWLVQFALMGSVYTATRYGIARPRVGLLSIGEEPSKGNKLVKETFPLLNDLDGINFIGNVEGRDVMTDDVDVIVTDGFTGNVVLKTLEGGLKAVVSAVFAALSTEAAGAEGAAAVGHLVPLAGEFDPDSIGGSMLLGVKGVSIISHGSSSATAVVNAISAASELADSGLVEAMTTAVSVAAHDT